MPKVGTRLECVRAGVLIAEAGIEYLTFSAVAAVIGIQERGVRYHFPGGREALRAAVLEHAARTRNPFILGQLAARRRDGGFVR